MHNIKLIRKEPDFFLKKLNIFFLNFNNKYCPRDAKDQVKYFKKDIKLKSIKKNDIIFEVG